jgi:hypothetical protein
MYEHSDHVLETEGPSGSDMRLAGRRRKRARKASALAVTAGALVAVGVASASVVSYTSGPLTATFAAGTHHPNCKQYWPVTVTARYHGQPAHAIAWYQFLYNGRVVGTEYPFGGKRQNPHYQKYHFYNSFTDTTFGPFGALSVGRRLTVRAVVQVSRYTAYPSYSVVVVNARGCPTY